MLTCTVLLKSAMTNVKIPTWDTFLRQKILFSPLELSQHLFSGPGGSTGVLVFSEEIHSWMFLYPHP